MSLIQVRYTRTYTPDNSGTVPTWARPAFELSGPVTDGAGQTVIPEPVQCTVNVSGQLVGPDGQIGVLLYALDLTSSAGQVQPQGRVYTVTEPKFGQWFLATASTDGPTKDLAVLTPAQPSNPMFSYASQAGLSAEIARAEAAEAAKVPLAGGTMTGPLVLAADPTLPLGAATKEYVDAHGGAVSSVFGRSGAVLPAAGDYTAEQIGPSGAFDVAENLAEGNAVTMRTNLGLQSAATQPASAFDAAGAAGSAQAAAQAYADANKLSAVSGSGGVQSSGGLAPVVSLADIPSWVTATNYTKDQLVLSPAGGFVAGVVSLCQAKTTHTSGASFSGATNWLRLSEQGGAYVPVPTEVVGGNLGATYSLALTSKLTWVTGTLNANCAITITGLTAGCEVLFLLAQDATGGRTLSVNGASLSIPTTPNAFLDVKVWSPDGATLYVEAAPQAGPTGPTGATGAIGPTGPTGPTGPAGGGILASLQYAPGPSQVTKTISTTTLTAVDTTNLTFSFTIPASGSVLLRATASVTSSGCFLSLGWVLHNTSTWFGFPATVSDTGGVQCVTPAFLVTGLTPGALIQVDLAAGNFSAGTSTIAIQGRTALTQSGAGPVVLEAWPA